MPIHRDRERGPYVRADAVGWPRLPLRSLRADAVEQRLPHVAVLGARRVAKVELYVTTIDAIESGMIYAPLPVATDPDAG
jgi:hypothetical protein